jgi:hypothetical protein
MEAFAESLGSFERVQASLRKYIVACQGNQSVLKLVLNVLQAMSAMAERGLPVDSWGHRAVG